MITFADVRKLPARGLPMRGIGRAAAQLYDVRCEVDTETGEPVAYYYPLFREGKLAGYQYKKARIPGAREKGDTGRIYKDQQLKTRGCTPFGAHVAGSGGKMVVVTEGAEDCLAAVQMFRKKKKPYRVVSTLGTDGWKRTLEYFETFDKVVIAYDQDEAGIAAAKEFSAALSSGKAHIMHWDKASDPNALLLRPDGADVFLNSLFQAKPPEAAGIIYGEAAWHIIENYREPESIPYPPEFVELNKRLRGMRRGDISLWTSGTGCVSGDTEYLTPTGWQRIDQYVGGPVGEVRPGGEVVFVSPDRYIAEPAEHLYHMSTKYGVDMKLCEEHRVIYSPEAEPLNWREKALRDVMAEHSAKATGFRGRIPTTFFYNSTALPYTDAQIRLHVMVSADGYIDPRRGTTHVNVKKPRKIARARELLAAAGLEWKEHEGAPGYVRFAFRQQLGKGYDEAWYGASDHQRRIILEEVVHWDGNGSNRFYSTIKSQADYIQWVAHSQGVRASMQVVPRPSKGHTEYNLCFSTHTDVSFRKGAGEKPEWRKVPTEDGMKYCFTVPSGMLLLRHNNHIFITGNCGKSAFVRRIKQHIIQATEWRVGDVELEETKEKTIRAMLQYQGKKSLRDMTMEEKRAAHDATYGSERLFTVDRRSKLSKGASLLGQMKHLHYGMGCDIIFLDHITLAQDEMGEGKEGLAAQDRMMSDLLDLVESTNIHIALISHLRKAASGSKSFEEGHMPSLDDLKGSGSVKQISMDIIALGRNLQHPDPYQQNVTKMRVLKNREDGNVGDADRLFYNKDSYSFEKAQEEVSIDYGEDDDNSEF